MFRQLGNEVLRVLTHPLREACGALERDAAPGMDDETWRQYGEQLENRLPDLHEWLLKFLGHRIADQRLLRLIRKWLRAGVSEDGQWSKTAVGTPQGAVISPIMKQIVSQSGGWMGFGKCSAVMVKGGLDSIFTFLGKQK